MQFTTLRNRIVFWVGLFLLVTTLSGLAVSTLLFMKKAVDARSAAIQAGEERIVNVAEKLSAIYEKQISQSFGVARDVTSVVSLASQDGSTVTGDVQLSRDLVTAVLYKVIVKNPNFLGIYMDWEPNGFDGNDQNHRNATASDEQGRFMPWWANTAAGPELQSDFGTYEAELAEDYYRIPRETKQETMLDPYLDTIDGQQVLMTSVVVPILSPSDEFLGITGIDITISNLQETVEQYAQTVYNGAADIRVISSTGSIIADSSDRSLAGKLITDEFTDADLVMNNIAGGITVFHDPQGNVHAYAPIPLGETGSTWTVVITIPEKSFTLQADQNFTTTISWLLYMFGAAILSLAVALFAFWKIANSISQPIQSTAQILTQVSQGNLTQMVPESLRLKKDEIGLLARATDAMSDSLREIFDKLTSSIQTLASTSAELSAISEEMNAGAVESSEQASQVVKAAQRMSSSTESAALDVQNANHNLSFVAASTEQMTHTIGEIASNSENARQITNQAADQAERISRAMLKLNQAAQAIDQITETITSISNQTNLLALNATIEAARAGAAGKGFAVVANEIKDLSLQTANATTEIKQRIAVVQESTHSAVIEIEAVTGIISQVNSIVGSIATAIEEQSMTTRDIAGNIGQASGDMKDAESRVSEAVASALQVADDISGVSANSQRIVSASAQVQASAFDLARLAESVEVLVEKFKH
jgi:methyl-accepting chemotaxis protein